MSVFEILVWVVLFAESDLALACIMKGIHARFAVGKKRARRNSTEGENCLAQLVAIADTEASRWPDRLRQRIEQTKKRAQLARQRDPLASIIVDLLDSKIGRLELREACDASVVNTSDHRKALRLYGFLIKTAPPVGVAGTLVGLLILLQDLTPGGGLPEGFITGLAIVLISSIWGIFVMFAAKWSADFLWMPYLERLAEDLEVRAVTCRAQVSKLLTRLADQEPKPRPEEPSITRAKTDVAAANLLAKPSGNGKQVKCPDSI